MINSKLTSLIIKLTMILSISYPTLTMAEGFERLGSIPSSNGLYYTTMATHGDFIAMGDQRSPGEGIDIIYIGMPEYMFEIGYVHTGHMTYELAWEGNYIYAPASWDGLFIYDVSDLTNILHVSDMAFGDPITATLIRDDFALLGGVYNLYSIDISDPHNPTEVWSSSGLGCSKIVAGDTIAYCYQYLERVAILNISSPECPIEISRFSCIDVTGIAIDYSERYLYLSAGFRGLLIYNIEDPTSPQFIGETSLPYQAYGIDVCVSDKYPHIVFISGYTGGLWAVDVSDPTEPLPMHHFMPPTQSHYVISYRGTVFHTFLNSLVSLEYTPESTDIHDHNPEIPTGFSLSQNYPNPFNTATVIEYSLPTDGYSIIEVYNIIGQKVETLVSGMDDKGHKSIIWDANDLSSGVYFYKLTLANRTLTKSLTLLE
ncbi:MAG: T9SS type A sorting domain-containing protein [candidate division Zixibacteria bacterium]